MSLNDLMRVYKGKGNWGHAGRPGKRGGSLSRSLPSVRSDFMLPPATPVDPKKVEKTKLALRDKVFVVTGSHVGRADDKLLSVVSEWGSRHPLKVFKHIKGIVMTTSPGDFAGLAKEGGINAKEIPTVAAFWNPKEKMIVMRRGMTDNQLTFHHEVGHVVYDHSSSFTWTMAYRNNDKFDRHTEYSKTHFKEGFADSYSAYIHSNGKSNIPEIQDTFNVVSEVIGSLK